MTLTALKHQFVSSVPEKLDDGVLYVSVQYRTAIHKCCCGCGSEVVTPLSPTDWRLTFDGVSISLYPSIGNWSLACQAHYWIDQNAVKWAGRMSADEVAAVRKQDQWSKSRYYGAKTKPTAPTKPIEIAAPSKPGLLARFAKWWS